VPPEDQTCGCRCDDPDRAGYRKKMKQMTTRVVIAATIATASLGFGLAPAGAQPNDNASCAALVGTHGPLGSQGEYQRTEHDPTFGHRAVRFVATFGDCDALLETLKE
jgi:hypothetical protein